MKIKFKEKETLKEALNRSINEVNQKIIDCYEGHDLVSVERLKDEKQVLEELKKICEERGRY